MMSGRVDVTLLMAKTPTPRISNWILVVFAAVGCLAGFALVSPDALPSVWKNTMMFTVTATRTIAGGAVPRPPQRPSFRLPPAALPSLPILSVPESVARPERLASPARWIAGVLAAVATGASTVVLAFKHTARRDASAPPSPHLRPTAAFTVTNSVDHMTPLSTRRAAVFRSMGLAVAAVVLGITSAVAVAAPFSGPDTVDPMSEMTKSALISSFGIVAAAVVLSRGLNKIGDAAEVITTAVPPLSASSLGTSKKAGEAMVEVSRAATEAKETVVSVGRAFTTALADASCERRRYWPHVRFFLNIASFTLGVCVVVLVKILLH
eukprot:TRINITY_DN992_c0_g1_i5.p1 TRINITY_DN992_c0_g1~~TRINITY_DN992_c0_g1_i5.p1  ORF type:complete len:331 (+),score=18.51 TRINITY_DN992_c0_g1_i5:26-994(+)